MSRVGSQQRTFLGLLARLRPHLVTDPALPSRIESLLARDHRLGSRDRRLFRELLYTTVRYRPWIEPWLDPAPTEAVKRAAWLAAELPAVQAFRDEAAAGLPPCPAAAAAKAEILGTAVADLNPRWLAEECPAATEPPLLDILLARAPLWVRLQNGDPAPALAEFEAMGWAAAASPLAPAALRLPPDTDVTKTQAFQEGRVEVQDLGSQLVLAAAAVRPGDRWLDACAGAGGKTLQLAERVGPAGRVTARDIRPAALAEMRRRATRAGLAVRIDTAASDPREGFDGVLVDAPCSGSGTWRRSPHLRWTTNPATVAAAAREQRRILGAQAARVRPGGVLVYATCSLCRSENEGVVEAFLADHGEFSPEIPGHNLRPPAYDGDCFFVAVLRRR